MPGLKRTYASANIGALVKALEAKKRKITPKRSTSIIKSLKFNAAIGGKGSIVTSGFPRKAIKTLRYAQQVTLQSANPATDWNTAQVFRANSCYDPDNSLGGHQPLGFDQLMLYYNNYKVLRSRIRVIFTPFDVSNQFPVQVAINLNRDPVDLVTQTAAVWETLLEQPLTGNAVTMGSTVTGFQQGQGSCIAVHSFDAKEFFGARDLDVQEYGGDSANNPNVQAYFTIACNSLTAAQVDAATCRIELEYDVEFTEPKSLIGS